MLNDSRRPHKEVQVKVNAWVDEGIAPIITALNQFERVETVDSCQGYGSKWEAESIGVWGDQLAYTYFRFRGTARDLLTFLQDLSVSLGTRLDSCCDYRLRAEWLAGAKEPIGQLLVRLDYVPTLAEALLGVHQAVAGNAEHLTVT
jgi:hypothetical protein